MYDTICCNYGSFACRKQVQMKNKENLVKKKKKKDRERMMQAKAETSATCVRPGKCGCCSSTKSNQWQCRDGFP